jgi:hypothetical protein
MWTYTYRFEYVMSKKQYEMLIYFVVCMNRDIIGIFLGQLIKDSL